MSDRQKQRNKEVVEILKTLHCGKRREKKFFCCKNEQPVTPTKPDPSDDVSFLPSAGKFPSIFIVLFIL